ncbi:MAG: 4Fe-4S binding protein [Euryarchaeota archaeon]|nr:4Fe-4S binding protein [Euryarchaeota archaeon]
MPLIHQALCAQCGGCVGVCPEDALTLRFKELRLDQARCTECNLCVALCPVDAIDPVKPFTTG